jgi:hypothetical protein
MPKLAIAHVASFDYLIGAGEERGRDREAERHGNHSTVLSTRGKRGTSRPSSLAAFKLR